MRARAATQCEKCQASMQAVGGMLRCASCGHQQAEPLRALLPVVKPDASNYQQPATGAPAVPTNIGVLGNGLNPLQLDAKVTHFEQPDYRVPPKVKGIADYPVHANANALQIGPTPAKRYVQPGGDPRG